MSALAEKRDSALQLADQVRLAKAADRQHIRRRRLNVSDLIDDPAEHWHSTMVYEAMLLAPGFSARKLRAFNETAMWLGINVATTLAGLDGVEREFVVEYLRERGL